MHNTSYQLKLDPISSDRWGPHHIAHVDGNKSEVYTDALFSIRIHLFYSHPL
jgi:hypothetical protein